MKAEMDYTELQAAIAAGKIKYSHTAWHRGYVSRRTMEHEYVVSYNARGGRYAGWWYVDAPSWESTQYHRRIWYAPAAN